MPAYFSAVPENFPHSATGRCPKTCHKMCPNFFLISEVRTLVYAPTDYLDPLSRPLSQSHSCVFLEHNTTLNRLASSRFRFATCTLFFFGRAHHFILSGRLIKQAKFTLSEQGFGHESITPVRTFLTVSDSLHVMFDHQNHPNRFTIIVYIICFFPMQRKYLITVKIAMKIRKTFVIIKITPTKPSSTSV